MDVLVLDTTSKSLRGVLGEAITTNQVDFTVHYGDVTSSGLVEGSNVAVSNGVTNVEILPVPAASTRRVVKNITVHNSDTVTHNISLMLRNTATDYLLTKLYLLAGESWDFTEDGVPFLIPTKASAADINAGTDDVKFATAKSLKNSTNVPSVSPSSLGNLMTSNGTNWVSQADDGWKASSATWSYSSIDSPTGVISVNADVTALIQKGMRLKYNQAQALTAYFPFDANSTSTVGSFTSTDVATPTYTAGKFSNALTLNGSTQAVVITDTALMKPTGEYTFGCWFKTSATGAYRGIFSSYSQNTAVAGIQLNLGTNNALYFICGKNTGTSDNVDYIDYVGTTTVTDGNWHYVVVSYRNNYIQIYLDGQLEISGYMLTPAYAATNYVRIACTNSTGSNTSFFSGQIDDLFLINGYALDEETIKAKYIASSAQGTGDITVTKKAIVTNVGAWSGSATLITAYHGTDFMLANASITSPYYSNVKVPFGFNVSPDKWMVIYGRNVSFTKTSPGASTWYYTELGSDNITAPIGAWHLLLKAEVYVFATGAGAAAIVMWAGISTANSGAPNLFKSRYIGTALTSLFTGLQLTFAENVTYSTKTPLYVLYMVESAMTSIISDGVSDPVVFKLVSAYL